MRRALLAVAFVVAATALPSSVVTATSFGDPHVGNPGGNCDPGLYKVNTSNDGKVFPAGWTVCLKASDGNTGTFVTDGTTTIGEYIEESGLLNNGGQVPGISNFVVYSKGTPPKKRKVLRYGGRILGPCGDPFYTARIWNGAKSTRPVTIILEVRNGRTLWKRTLQPGQSIKPRATWLPGGKVLILRRGNGTVIDRERTVSGTYSWSECRNG